MSECDVKHEERLRRYRLRVIYHPEWGSAVVHAAGVGRDVPGVSVQLSPRDWRVPSTRKLVTDELMDRAERALDDLPEPEGETPWNSADWLRALLFACIVPYAVVASWWNRR